MVAKTVSQIRRTTIPHPPWHAYMNSVKKSAPMARLRKNMYAMSHEKKNCFEFPGPRIAQPTTPSSAHAAPMTGMRFQECPGGIVASSFEIIQDSRSSTFRAPSDVSSFRVADASNLGSHDSIEMKKASSVTRSKTFEWKSGWWCIGSRLRPSMPKTAPNAAKRTPSSNVIGINAGQEKYGLPLITRGYALAWTHHCRPNPPAAPVNPAARTIQGSGERRIP